MFRWFRATCPVDSAAKSWIERRLMWLDNEFPENAFNDEPIVLPTADFFPDPYDGSEEAVRAMLDRVCGYMGVAPGLVELAMMADAGKIWLVNESGQYLPGAAGLFEEGEDKFVVRIDKLGLDEPLGLVGTMAHELAHVRLLGEGRIDVTEGSAAATPTNGPCSSGRSTRAIAAWPTAATRSSPCSTRLRPPGAVTSGGRENRAAQETQSRDPRAPDRDGVRCCAHAVIPLPAAPSPPPRRRLRPLTPRRSCHFPRAVQ